MTPNQLGILLLIVFVALPATIWAWRFVVLAGQIALVCGAWLLAVMGAAISERSR